MPVTTVGDLDIVWEEAGDGAPVVMINGIGSPRAGWNMTVPDVSDHFRAITFDNRDVGETGAGRDDRFYRMRIMADDVAGLMDEIGLRSAHIVGASMGGAIAQEFAINHPEKTRSVTIVCSWAKTDPWMDELWELWEHLFEAQGPVEWARTTWLWVFTHRWYRDPTNLQNLIAATVADRHPQTLEMYRRQSHAARRHDTLDRLAQIAAPTHVICGVEDIFTPLRYSEEIAAAIPGARLTLLPEAGHGMFWEQQTLFNQAVVEFIAGVEEAR
jgi:3-oxoadipate enol-lactonase